MPDYLVTTESGADYRVDTDRGFWNHRGTGRERIYGMKTGTIPCWPWNGGDWEDAKEPEVGKLLFLTSMNYWRVSTPVVSVVEQ